MWARRLLAVVHLAGRHSVAAAARQAGRHTWRPARAVGLPLLLGGTAAGGLGLALCEAADETVEGAEALYGGGAGDKAQVYAYVARLVARQPGNTQALWRMARAAYDLAQASTQQADRQRLTQEALHWAKEALQHDDTSYAAHKWYAIALSAVGDYEGVTKKIENAFLVREHFERAAALNPSDATTQHLLGLWHFTIADMPWYTRKVAATIFAAPPETTFEQALYRFHLAEEKQPRFYKKNALYIGKTYDRLGLAKEAQEWYARALAMPIANADDQAAHDEAQKLHRPA